MFKAQKDRHNFLVAGQGPGMIKSISRVQNRDLLLMYKAVSSPQSKDWVFCLCTKRSVLLSRRSLDLLLMYKAVSSPQSMEFGSFAHV